MTVDSLAHRVYVAVGGGIAVIDSTTDTITETIPVGNDNRSIGVDTSTGDLYVTTGICEVLKVDGVTHVVTAISNVCIGTAIDVDSTPIQFTWQSARRRKTSCSLSIPRRNR